MLLEVLSLRALLPGTIAPQSLLQTKHGLFMLLTVLGMQIQKRKPGMFVPLDFFDYGIDGFNLSKMKKYIYIFILFFSNFVQAQSKIFFAQNHTKVPAANPSQ